MSKPKPEPGSIIVRAEAQTISAWKRKAKAAGMSLNRWANLVLNNAPEVKPAQIAERE